MDDEPTIASELSKHLSRTSKSRAEIARELGLDNSQYIDGIATGRVRPSLEHVIPLAHAVGMDPALMAKLWVRSTFSRPQVSKLREVLALAEDDG